MAGPRPSGSASPGSTARWRSPPRRAHGRPSPHCTPTSPPGSTPTCFPCTADTLDRLLGADDRWTNPAAMMDPSQSVGQSPDARALRLLADDLVALLDAQTPRLIAASTPEDWDRARLYGRTATGLLRYHFWMADTSPSRMTRLLGPAGLDDGGQPARPRRTGPGAGLRPQRPSPAGQEHDAAGRQPLEWWSAGAIVTPTWRGVRLPGHGPRHDPPPRRGHPAPGHLEGLLYALPEDRSLIDARRLAAALGDAARPACPPGSATPRWTRPTWPTSTGSCSSRTAIRCDLTGELRRHEDAAAEMLGPFGFRSWLPAPQRRRCLGAATAHPNQARPGSAGSTTRST